MTTSVKPGAMVMALSALFFSKVVFAGWHCPGDDQVHVVTGVGFDNKNDEPRVHFGDQKESGDWSYLSYAFKSGHPEADAMLAIALTAYSAAPPVRTRCAVPPFVKAGETVDGFWISNDGSQSPN